MQLHTIVLMSSLLAACWAASISTSPSGEKIRWCTISKEEDAKCKKLSASFAAEDLQPVIECVQKYSRSSCAVAISKNQADIVVLDPREGFFTSKIYPLVPLLAERYFEYDEKAFAYKSVIVVKKSNTNIHKLEDIKGSKACLPGVGASNWIPQISKFAQLGLLTGEKDCYGYVYGASKIVNSSCSPDATLPFFSRPGDDVSNLCELCAGDEETKCTTEDPYAGQKGAFKCLADNAGDVAFLHHYTILEATVTDGQNPQDYELLCQEGARKPIEKYDECNWGVAPSWALYAGNHLSKKALTDIRELLLSFKDKNQLFQSESFGGKDLLFTDKTKNLVDITTDDIVQFVGTQFANDMDKFLEGCSDPTEPSVIRWCTVSDQEFDKCTELEMFGPASSIRPLIKCVKSATTHDCFALLRGDNADAVTLDGGDVYVAGKEYGLGPIAYEDSGRGEAKYYAVAVAKKSDPSITFKDLKGKKSCHTGVGRTAGWNVPIATLLQQGHINAESGCDVVPATGHFFSQSCAPGAKDPAYNPTGNGSDILCALCKGEGEHKCDRADSEPYFGYTGAFRCLVEGGDVAFVNHHTVGQNTDNANKAEWASKLKSEDFELLCPDGSRRGIKEFEQCHLAKVPSHAVVINVQKGDKVITAFQRALGQLEYHFGDDANNKVRLFTSAPGFKDVLFQDATKNIIPLPTDMYNYAKYLGSYVDTAEFLQTKICNVLN